jgi:hypothetical protein
VCNCRPARRGIQATEEQKGSDEEKTLGTKEQNESKQRANIVTKYFNNKMKSKLEKKREVYYKDAEGIELNYPIGAEIRNLDELKIAHNDKEDNNFNVYIGCERGKKRNQHL